MAPSSRVDGGGGNRVYAAVLAPLEGVRLSQDGCPSVGVRSGLPDHRGWPVTAANTSGRDAAVAERRIAPAPCPLGANATFHRSGRLEKFMESGVRTLEMSVFERSIMSIGAGVFGDFGFETAGDAAHQSARIEQMLRAEMPLRPSAAGLEFDSQKISDLRNTQYSPLPSIRRSGLSGNRCRAGRDGPLEDMRRRAKCPPDWRHPAGFCRSGPSTARPQGPRRAFWFRFAAPSYLLASSVFQEG